MGSLICAHKIILVLPRRTKYLRIFKVQAFKSLKKWLKISNCYKLFLVFSLNLLKFEDSLEVL